MSNDYSRRCDTFQLMSGLSQASMVDVLLKHVHKLAAFYSVFPRLTKIMLKVL